jgi:cell division protease FtsH
MNGHKKKTSDRDLHEIETTAYHEAGHALVGHLLGEDVSKISIIPTTSGAGGVTIFNQKKLGMYSKQELENKVKMLYAGRNAELILNGPSGITTGASNDIKEATKIIISMVSSYGMSSYGLLDLTQIQQEEELLKEYQKISEELNRECSILLKENKDKLDALAHVLIQKETIDENELKEIYSSFDEINPEHILSEGVVLEDNFEDDSSEEYDSDDDTFYDDSNTEDEDLRGF